MRRCNRHCCAYILWGDQFNEVMATLFASELRAAGWRTWFVGLHGAEHAGRYGVTLVADLSLGEALRAPERMVCLVAPCPQAMVSEHLDPRLRDLVQKARTQQAVLITETEGSATATCQCAHNPQAMCPVKATPSHMTVAALLQELSDRLHQ